MLNLLLVAGGFIPLIWGANLLVDSATSLARWRNIPNMVIGLTIVAFGTSMPELLVNLFAAADGNSAIALGNVTGSNIMNILVILGVSALIRPLAVRKQTTWIEIPLAMLAAAVVLVLANDVLLDGGKAPLLTRSDGIILLLFFLVFLGYNIQLAKTGSFDADIPAKDYPPLKAALFLLAGLGLLFAGGRVIVTAATAFARELGIAERIIAVTIISLGTSLPELATSAIAARKGNVDIAIGNIVGSCICNTFCILGISAVIHPLPVPGPANVDLLVSLCASILLFAFVFTGRGRQISRIEGGIFLLCYAGYAVSLLL